LNEHRQVGESNERLEFLGDAVLELVVSFHLFQKFPKDTEGKLTLYRSKIVQTKTLAAACQKLGLPPFLRLAKGERESGGPSNESLLADTFEALIGAIFIDQGLAVTTKFITRHLLINLNEILKSPEVIDFKSLYQEQVQAKNLPTPIYKIVASGGPDHDKNFIAAVTIAGREIARGSGKSKQVAEQAAAKVALEKSAKKE
jgi:ribonuclease-3